jgi:hypothetical protein
MVMAFIYSINGQYDEALKKLDYLLSIPSDCSIGYIKAEPIFAPLRDLPGFAKLVKKYSSLPGS